MDTFMDKLAQKLNAQEMIKANSAADAEEMDQLKNQLREYDECLAQMQQANKELRAVNHAMETLMSETIAPEVTKLPRKRSCHSQDAAGEYGKAAGAAAGIYHKAGGDPTEHGRTGGLAQTSG